MNTRLALLLAIVLGVVAALAARTWVTNEQARLEAELDNTLVIAAATSLRPGHALRPGDMRPKEFPRAELVNGIEVYSPTEVQRLVGRTVTTSMNAGDIIFSTLLRADAQRAETQTGVISPGKLGVTLRVDAVSSHNYLLRPGDIVEIVGYFNVAPGSFPALAGSPLGDGRPGGPPAPPPPPPAAPDAAARNRGAATLLFAEAVQVLAVGSFTADRIGSATRDMTYNTITVELDPDNALYLLDAVNQGAQLSFPLRSRVDRERRGGGIAEVDWRRFRQAEPPPDEVLSGSLFTVP